MTQARFQGVKLYHNTAGTWSQVASFNISHTGFCRGYVETCVNNDNVLLVTPSEQNKIIVSKLAEKYVRPIVSLIKEDSGTVMSIT